MTTSPISPTSPGTRRRSAAAPAEHSAAGARCRLATGRHRFSSAIPALLALLAAPAVWAQGHACLIEPAQRMDIRSPVTGLIRLLPVDRGSVVQKGQVLVELDTALEASTLASARYRSQMLGEQRAAQARADFARTKAKRLEQLKEKDMISAQDRDEAAASALVAEADLLVARDNRELAALETRRLNEALEQRRLRSPVQALVTDRFQHPGELAHISEGSKPILRLAVVHPLRVELVLPVSRLNSIRVGENARIVPEAPVQGSWTATVRQIDRVVDAASGTFRVLLELPNADGAITAGIKCTATFAR